MHINCYKPYGAQFQRLIKPNDNLPMEGKGGRGGAGAGASQ